MNKLSRISSLSFDEYITLCIDDMFIDTLSTTLSLSKSKVKYLLTCYVFKFFPSEIMDPLIRSPEDIEIINISNDVINNIEMTELKTLLNIYIQKFKDWKEFDKPRTIAPFIKKYKCLRYIRENNKSRYYEKELKTLIDMTFLQLITMIHSIGGEESLYRIDSDIEPSRDDNLNIEFLISSKETFWLSFREELPNYIRLIPLLFDFLERYRSLIPNRSDVLNDMMEFIDLEFIKERIDNGVVTIDYLLRYMDYIVLKIKQIDTPSNDEYIDVWFENLKSLQITDSIYFLQSFFDYIFIRLDEIYRLSTTLKPIIRNFIETNLNDNNMIE